jgi:hypothetical protein
MTAGRSTAGRPGRAGKPVIALRCAPFATGTHLFMGDTAMARKLVLFVGTIAVTAALAACSSSDPSSGAPGTSAAVAGQAGGSEVGPAGSACPMPVTFGVVDKWKPAAVTDGNSSTGELVCEISARATGQTGFLRVYRLTGVADAKAALTKYTSRPTYSDKKFTDIKTGTGDGQEVAYTIDSAGTKLPGLVFAAPVADGAVVVSLDAIDEDTQKANMSAYELAKSSLKVTG